MKKEFKVIADLLPNNSRVLDVGCGDGSLMNFLKEEKNIDKLINSIKENLKNKFISSEEIFITRERHRINLEQCFASLKDFEQKKSLEDFDKAAEDLRLATRYLGIIVGKVDIEEILGSIFNDFCIGK